ncbi:hypothetical protein ACQP0C_28305 [Nocardia sp. CA-129566]|uniref:hypothetical protein n=1 Tax=Nocardia sp. CA-129566 TaxID=3239976 RepID=UPI003D969C65
MSEQALGAVVTHSQPLVAALAGATDLRTIELVEESGATTIAEQGCWKNRGGAGRGGRESSRDHR